MNQRILLRTFFVLSAAVIVTSTHCSEEDNGDNDQDTESYGPTGYIFTSPRTLKTGESNELHLQLFGHVNSGVLTVEVTGKKDYNPPTDVVAAAKKFKIQKGQRDVILNLPVEKFDDYIYDGVITISGAFGKYKIFGNDTISLSASQKSIIIIQTDKPLYQPGQTVKFRVLSVDKYLKPCIEYNIAQVYVEDAKGTRLFQFNDLDLSQGIVQREFPLSDEPVKGTWTIKVTTNGTSDTGRFEVKDYVLPKFDVQINVPKFVLGNAEIVPIQICAKYTYGKPLVGTLNLNVSLEKYYYSQDKYPTLQESVEINGCYDYDINVCLIEPDDQYTYRRIQIVANVIEAGTGVERNVTQFIDRITVPLFLQFTDQREYFKPGLPFYGKLKVTNPDNSKAAGELIEICAKITKQRVLAEWWATKTYQLCKNYTSDEDGIIYYTIYSKNVDEVSIQLNARAPKYSTNHDGKRENILSQPQTSAYLRPFYSPSGSFIQIQPVVQPVACGKRQNFKLLFTSQTDCNLKFYYQVSRQADLVLTDSIETSFSTDNDVSSDYENDESIINAKKTLLVPSPQQLKQSPKTKKDCPAAADTPYTPYIGEINIDIKIKENLSPVFYFLVYYTRNDREVVADSLKIEVEKCFRNKVDFAFGDEKQQPGLTTSIQVTAAPNSLCGIKTIDKSLLLLDSSDQVTKDNVFQKLSNQDVNNYYPDNPCYKNTIQPGLANSKYQSIIWPRPPSYGSSSYEDALTSFQVSGLLTISDFLLFTRPCTDNSNIHVPIYRHGGVAYSKSVSNEEMHVSGDRAGAGGGGPSSTTSVKEVRDYFPETWLFELEMTGPDGTFAAKEQLPDTITEWVGSAVCVNAKEGLGISNTTSIIAFQAFFIDYTLPISVIRGETFKIVVTIFSYTDGALPITVSLSECIEFEVVGDSIDGDYCILPGTSISLSISLKAKKIGNVNITVSAETSESSSACDGHDTSNNYARDAITKPIEVVAEGFPAEDVINTLFCPSDEESFVDTISLSLPFDVIQDSARAYMDFTGNVMGPAINNLNRLVSLPTGCGEQNMVKFTPNYVVLDYLKSINMLTENIKTKAIRNLISGYQRELNYRHYDGSFSAFGEVDKQGSTFLTSFVLHSFTEAKRYIYIDDNVLTGAQNWLISRQNADGCFQNVGQIIDIGLEGGIENDISSGSITAYVIASLYISEFKNETILNGAFACLDKYPAVNPYSQFLYAYANALGGRNSAAQEYIDKARQKVNSTGGMEFFNIVNGTEAIRIETNAYAVLTTLAVGGSASDALAYVRYMTAHLNPYGGFRSTQDTCVGLQALAQFGKLINKNPLDLEVTTKGGLEQTVKINEENKLVVQRFKVSDVPTDVTIEATGTGCGLIQTSVRYNTKFPPQKKMFSLEVRGECSFSGCHRATINVLVSYLPPERTAGMSILEIKLITGFVADMGSLEQLKSDESNKILRIDIENNVVIFYFSEISNKVQSFSFQVEQIVDCQDAQPGTAKVYDYYANENSQSTSYVIDGFNSDNKSGDE